MYRYTQEEFNKIKDTLPKFCLYVVSKNNLYVKFDIMRKVILSEDDFLIDENGEIVL